MQPILHERGYEVIYHESGGAHNFTTWRDGLARGLEALFGS
jgi:enterochelin esterase-like enzyme